MHVDGIGRWTAVAIGKVEVECELFGVLARHFEAGQVVVFNLDHAVELLEILARSRTRSIPRSSAIEAAANASSDARLSFKMIGSGGSKMVSHEQRAMIANFSMLTNCLAIATNIRFASRANRNCSMRKNTFYNAWPRVIQ